MAHASEQPVYDVDLRLYKTPHASEIRGLLTLQPDEWHAAGPLALHNTGSDLEWQPESEAPDLLAAQTLELKPGERGSIKIQDTLPEWFEPIPDRPGYYHHRIGEHAPSLTVSVRFTPVGPDWIILNSLAKFSSVRRDPLADVRLPIGKPNVSTFVFRTDPQTVPLNAWIVRQVDTERSILAAVRVRLRDITPAPNDFEHDYAALPGLYYVNGLDNHAPWEALRPYMQGTQVSGDLETAVIKLDETPRPIWYEGIRGTESRLGTFSSARRKMHRLVNADLNTALFFDKRVPMAHLTTKPIRRWTHCEEALKPFTHISAAHGGSYLSSLAEPARDPKTNLFADFHLYFKLNPKEDTTRLALGMQLYSKARTAEGEPCRRSDFALSTSAPLHPDELLALRYPYKDGYFLMLVGVEKTDVATNAPPPAASSEERHFAVETKVIQVPTECLDMVAEELEWDESIQPGEGQGRFFRMRVQPEEVAWARADAWDESDCGVELLMAPRLTVPQSQEHPTRLFTGVDLSHDLGSGWQISDHAYRGIMADLSSRTYQVAQGLFKVEQFGFMFGQTVRPNTHGSGYLFDSGYEYRTMGHSISRGWFRKSSLFPARQQYTRFTDIPFEDGETFGFMYPRETDSDGKALDSQVLVFVTIDEVSAPQPLPDNVLKAP
jgi:hypothetical protein